MLLKNYTYNCVNNIDHQALVKERKANIEKADCEYNIQKGVYLPSLKIELGRIVNQ